MEFFANIDWLEIGEATLDTLTMLGGIPVLHRVAWPAVGCTAIPYWQAPVVVSACAL